MHSQRTNPKQYEPAMQMFALNFPSPRQSIKFGWKEGREEGKGREGGRKRKGRSKDKEKRKKEERK